MELELCQLRFIFTVIVVVALDYFDGFSDETVTSMVVRYGFCSIKFDAFFGLDGVFRYSRSVVFNLGYTYPGGMGRHLRGYV
jgi:hypothetical protein